MSRAKFLSIYDAFSKCVWFSFEFNAIIIHLFLNTEQKLLGKFK